MQIFATQESISIPLYVCDKLSEILNLNIMYNLIWEFGI